MVGAAIGSALATMACATPGEEPPPVAGAGPCDAEAAQGLVGQQASQALGAEAMRLSGAGQLRWIPPRTAVTMDYRPNRLNVEYDDDNIVTRIRCG